MTGFCLAAPQFPKGFGAQQKHHWHCCVGLYFACFVSCFSAHLIGMAPVFPGSELC